MTFTTVLNKLKFQSLSNYLNNDLYLNALLTFSLLSLGAIGVWLIGPHLAWNDVLPLASPEKRLYVIALLYLLWLLKFLILDLDAPVTSLQNNLAAQKKILILHATFRNALLFLKKTVTTKRGKVKLNRLPWFLLLGPTKSGKTSLLSHSNVHFLLQKQSSKSTQPTQQPTENCEWWVTRDACIVDVPGKYLGGPQVGRFYSIALSLFLRLIKRHRGRHGVGGVILALPATFFLSGEKKQAALQTQLARLEELYKFFPEKLPCRIVITKCDLIPGFSEFFAEASLDEITQAWGIGLQEQSALRLDELFSERFNELIKKINQQLLWRLHQERNPFARPYIKDFPLQLEKIKHSLTAFFKSSAHLPITIQSIHLTSALQNKPEPVSNVIEHGANQERALQILHEPKSISRPHFIKQFLTQGLNAQLLQTSPIQQRYFTYAAYTLALAATIGTGLWLNNDFHKGVAQTQSIQQSFADYQKAMSQTHSQEQRLFLTNDLLNALEPPAEKIGWHINLENLFSFYSKKAQSNSTEIYRQALQQLLIPEIGTYYTDFLKIPVNRNADDVYAVLKAYLMLNDKTHFDASFILETTQTVLPKTFGTSQTKQLLAHLQNALAENINFPMSTDLVQQTRKYLVSMPSVQLSYIILKNINHNDSEQEVNLSGYNDNQPLFITKQLANQLPVMFTGSAFNNIMNQESVIATQEAVLGNWVLGQNTIQLQQPQIFNTLVEQVRTLYINNYVDAWETLLANVRLNPPRDLAETDQVLLRLLGNDSPLLILLRTVHDNTYFPPILNASPKLQTLDALIEKDTQSANTLFQIFAGLQDLHNYLQSVLTAQDPQQAAFVLLSNRLHHAPDAITQLHSIADQSPEPLKTWLNALDNTAWRFLMLESSKYLNTAWQQQVVAPYQAYIANRYPFNTASNSEVDLQQFVNFFGNPGNIVSFYNTYLSALIDNSNGQWRWKKVDDKPLPFSKDTLRQIQLAMHIHRAFFPDDNNILKVAFSLKPYDFNKNVKSVDVTIADQEFLDNEGDISPHEITWPTSAQANAALRLTMADNQIVTHHYDGNWGWYRMINQAFDSVISKNQLVLNFSMNENQAKYVLAVNGKHNPFLALNLQHFYFPQQL